VDCRDLFTEIPAGILSRYEVTVTFRARREILEHCESVGRSSIQAARAWSMVGESSARRCGVPRGLAAVEQAGTQRKTLVRELQNELAIFLQAPRLSVIEAGRLLN
jgi:hypothetical protein